MGHLCRIRNDFVVRVPADNPNCVLFDTTVDGGADDTQGSVGDEVG